MCFHGPNVERCEIVTGHTRTLLVSAYIPLLTINHSTVFEESLKKFKGLDPIVFGVLTWTWTTPGACRSIV